MRIYQLHRIGEHHINHCEDYTVVENLGQNKILCAVMDGCTMGRDSYFASTLTGKLLRKIAIEQSYQSFYNKNIQTSASSTLKQVLATLMSELQRLKSQLLLRDDELLTTLLLAVLDIDKNEGQILVIGDGLVCVNGKLTEYDHNNKPDYLGYHLTEDFDFWYSHQKQMLQINNIEDISICTDGIFTFSKHDKKNYFVQKDPLAYLLLDKEDLELENMLTKKYLYLEQNCGLKPTDDLGIVRLIRKQKNEY